MCTDEAKEEYKLMVEPVFGIIKEQQQARRFLLRRNGACWPFNLRTLWRVRSRTTLCLASCNISL